MYSNFHREKSRRDYPREDGGDQVRVKEEPPDGTFKSISVMSIMVKFN